MNNQTSRERRWLLLAGDGTGRHSWLGRATDPTDAELDDAARRLLDMGIPGGWVAVSEGSYYSADRISLLQVRRVGVPTATWDAAVLQFLAKRREANR